MRVKEIVDFLKVEEIAPFHFYTEILNKEYAVCKHITNEELDDYNKKICLNEKKYDDSELGIYIADITIDEMYDLEHNRNPVNLQKVLDDISDLFMVEIAEEELIYAIYVILHEVGHWVNFKASGKPSLEYALWDWELKKEYKQYVNEVRKIPDDSSKKLEFAKIAVINYKNIPSEKAADTYAFENIEEKLKLVRKYIDNSN